MSILLPDNQNRQSLEKLERCIFVLCLDEAVPVSFNHQCSLDETRNNMRDEVSLAGQMLHGSGSAVNSCNRWFDKTMQVRTCAFRSGIVQSSSAISSDKIIITWHTYITHTKDGGI